MRWNRTLLALCLGLLAVAPALGQGQQTGNLEGTVQASNGDPLPGVLVTVTSPALQGERTTTSGATGNYLVKGLPAGEYTVAFVLEGMRQVERSATINVGLVARVDAEMQLSEVAETLVVTGESPTALENTTIGANYDKETVDNLAMNRTVLEVAYLSPNVTDETSGTANTISIAGGLARDNVFMLNGVDITDPVNGQHFQVYIEDAILETQTLTSGVSAEYGRFAGGAINAITKSGGNQFSGSFRLSLENPSWRDETPLEDERGIKRDDSTQETYEATLGGYLMRDHLWFFLAGRDESEADQRNLSLTNVSFTDMVEDERFEIKLTGNIAQNHSVQLTYSERNTDDFGTSPATTGSTITTARTRELPNELLVGRYSGVLTSSLFAEAQYSERDFSFLNSGGTDTNLVTGTPFRCWNLATACNYNAPYFDSTDPEDRNNEQLAASLSYFVDSTGVGTHDLKVGFERYTAINTGGNSQSPTDVVLFMDPLLDASGTPVFRPDGSQDLVPVWNSAFDNVPSFGLGVFFEAVRGAELEIETDSIYVNDRWQLDDHWSFNIGFRYEDNSSSTNAGAPPVDTDSFVPRLAASYDLKGDGRYIFDATYGEYQASYNMSEFGVVTNVGNPSYLYGAYVGPTGVGIDFAPGFDMANYQILGGLVPTENVFIPSGINSNQVREWTLSGGMQLPNGGHLKLTYLDREHTEFVEDTIRIENGQTLTSIGQLLDNVVYVNTSEPERTYKALVLQGRYNVMPRWSVEGHWTHQLEHDGNWVGEAGASGAFQSGVGDYPEILPMQTYHPVGPLNTFQDDRIRLWSIYQQPLGNAGDMVFSLLWNYDSAYHFSNADRVPLSAQQQQILSDVGYATSPATPTVFFGGRGTEEYNDFDTFDFGVTYNLPVWKNLNLWVKGSVFNVFNDDTLRFFDTSITADANGPVDALGVPTTFTRDSTFGNPTDETDFVRPREYQLAVGLRF